MKREMENKTFYERWMSVHAINFIEKYPGKEPTPELVFHYLDSCNSIFLPKIMDKNGIEDTYTDFINTINDLR